MITLEVNGNRYTGFTDITVFRSIETISGSFDFSATSSDTLVFPIAAQDACKVYIGNIPVINGFVESVSVSYDASSHSISISGRDRTCDVIDSTIIGAKNFSGQSLVKIIQKVLSDNGLSTISVINNTGSSITAFNDAESSSSPVSQTIFEFIESYARKRQILITTDGEGNIVLARASTIVSSAVLENIIGGQFNNIKSATVNYDFTKRFYKYVMQSQQSPSSTLSFGDVALENVAVQTGSYIDNTIRNTRITEVISETSDLTTNLSQLASWTANLARTRSTEYKAVVQGYFLDSSKAEIWKPNLLVKVTDDFCNINATLLIKSVEYKLSVNDGSTTIITLVDADSYTLESQVEDATRKRNKKANKKGDELTWTDPN